MSPRVPLIGFVALVPLCAPLSWAATDAERLMALHEKVMRAHQLNSVELLLEDEAADYVVASRGEVSKPSIADRRARLGSYLQRTTFTEYRDASPPIVTVSADGTLGWVVVQVQARGEQTSADGKKQPLAFKLYKKVNGRWYRVGNVSNFKD